MMNIIDDIGLITVFLLILLSIFLLTSGKKNKIPNAFFALFLLVTSFDISALFLQNFYSEYQQMNVLRVSSVLLQMPLFYLYVQTICYSNIKPDAKQLLHTIPFFGFLILFAITGLSDRSYRWYGILAQIQYYIYIIAIFYSLKKYNRLHHENYSLQNKTYQWLMTVSILFLVGNSFVMLRSISRRFYDYQDIPLLNLGISLFGLAVICWFVIKTMRNPDLFLGIDQNIKPIDNTSVENKEEHEEEIQRLYDYMDRQKPFLEETLTLQKLAQQTNIPEKQLSFLINRISGKHFFDFINSYRIREAQNLLRNSDLNIQQIMYEVGFNSKSSFNTAFRKFSSTTPSKYRLSVK